MIFASPVFLFLFLPLFLAFYYATPNRFRSAVILLGSSVFYAWWRVDFLLLLYAIIVFSWGIGLGIEKYRARWLMQLGVGMNLLTLGYFKYWNFGVASFNDLLVHAGLPPSHVVAGVILPIGISFFVFHAISYIVDVWRRDVVATRKLIDFAAFVMLFPHLIAGPVLRYKDLAWQFANRTHSMALFSEGAYRFMSGFAKKVLIADTVAPLADVVFGLETPALGDAWLGVAAYTIQLFFDFAGYSEMAVGLALMMGFRFIENFNNPYLSRSITEFWRRWHISLSTWLRDYLYISLGGNRKGHVRTYISLFLTMLLGGLWHGANWTFVLWGAWHGMFLAVERGFGIDPNAPMPWMKRIATMAGTLLVVMVGWVLFRASNIGAALDMYRGMMGMTGTDISDNLGWQIKGNSIAALMIGIAVVFSLPFFNRYRAPVMLSKHSVAMQTHAPVILQIIVACLFLLAVTRLIAMSYSPFLYFQF